MPGHVGDKEGKISAQEYSGCWLKPMCSLYPDFYKTLLRDFDLLGFRGVQLHRNISRLFKINFYICSNTYFSSAECKDTCFKSANCVCPPTREKGVKRSGDKSSWDLSSNQGSLPGKRGTGTKRMALIRERENWRSGSMK